MDEGLVSVVEVLEQPHQAEFAELVHHTGVASVEAAAEAVEVAAAVLQAEIVRRLP